MLLLLLLLLLLIVTLFSQVGLSLKHTFLWLHFESLPRECLGSRGHFVPYSYPRFPGAFSETIGSPYMRQWFSLALDSMLPSHSAFQGEKVSHFSSRNLTEEEIRASETPRCPHFWPYEMRILWVNMNILNGHWLNFWLRKYSIHLSLEVMRSVRNFLPWCWDQGNQVFTTIIVRNFTF